MSHICLLLKLIYSTNALVAPEKEKYILINKENIRGRASLKNCKIRLFSLRITCMFL